MLIARGVTKAYGGGPPLFAPQDLAVDAAARVAVVGPQGRGKTTFLRLLAGLERPTSGTVTWDGVDLYNGARAAWTAHTRQVSLIFADHGLFPTRTLLENLILSQRLAGRPRRDAVQAAYAMLRRLDMTAVGDRYPHAIGESERRLMCVARAVVRRPRLVVADEPEYGLPPDAAQRVRQLLDEASVQGAAIVFSRHEGVTTGLCARAVVALANGAA